jgi:hypothetical protein
MGCTAMIYRIGIRGRNGRRIIRPPNHCSDTSRRRTLPGAAIARWLLSIFLASGSGRLLSRKQSLTSITSLVSITEMLEADSGVTGTAAYAAARKSLDKEVNQLQGEGRLEPQAGPILIVETLPGYSF